MKEDFKVIIDTSLNSDLDPIVSCAMYSEIEKGTVYVIDGECVLRIKGKEEEDECI